jgi:hypothetical protein
VAEEDEGADEKESDDTGFDAKSADRDRNGARPVDDFDPVERDTDG